jgi:peptidoglycan hydrolase CwlO-like protein
MDWPTSLLILGGVVSLSTLVLKLAPSKSKNSNVLPHVAPCKNMEALEITIKEMKEDNKDMDKRLDLHNTDIQLLKSNNNNMNTMLKDSKDNINQLFQKLDEIKDILIQKFTIPK